MTNPVMIPEHKADFNNNGPVSTDYIGHSWKYPEATYAEKAALWQDHLLYTQSFFYFLSQDAKVPASLREEVNQWGLPKDEFADTDHWPNQLYIREGRRLVGEYVMRQADLQTERTKPDSIGMGSYNSDSHNIQRVAMPDGTVQNEGDVQVPVEPYEIAYRSILPKRSEAENLLVPVCLSASHAAYSSVRMEPQYMIIGQAAGVAAALAVQRHRDVHDVEIPELQQKLRQHGAILHLDQEFSAVTFARHFPGSSSTVVLADRTGGRLPTGRRKSCYVVCAMSHRRAARICLRPRLCGRVRRLQSGIGDNARELPRRT